MKSKHSNPFLAAYSIPAHVANTDGYRFFSVPSFPQTNHSYTTRLSRRTQAIPPITLSLIHISEPTRRTPLYSSAASDVYKRQNTDGYRFFSVPSFPQTNHSYTTRLSRRTQAIPPITLSLIHISEPTRRTPI